MLLGCFPRSLEHHILNNPVLSQWWGTTASEFRMFFSSSSRDRGIFFSCSFPSARSLHLCLRATVFLFFSYLFLCFHEGFKVFCFLGDRWWVGCFSSPLGQLHEGGFLHSLVPQLPAFLVTTLGWGVPVRRVCE